MGEVHTLAVEGGEGGEVVGHLLEVPAELLLLLAVLCLGLVGQAGVGRRVLAGLGGSKGGGGCEWDEWGLEGEMWGGREGGSGGGVKGGNGSGTECPLPLTSMTSVLFLVLAVSALATSATSSCSLCALSSNNASAASATRTMRRSSTATANSARTRSDRSVSTDLSTFNRISSIIDLAPRSWGRGRGSGVGGVGASVGVGLGVGVGDGE